jgi:opacity protein-like surface antigen
MRHVGVGFAFIAALLICAAAAVAADSPDGGGAIRVWALLDAKVYHCPGSRWYGKGSAGTYMTECEAVERGCRPVFSQPCGSICTTPETKPSLRQRRAP